MKEKSLKEWFLATRPWSLPASSMAVIVAALFVVWRISSYEGLTMNWLNVGLALLSIMFFQLGGNLMSDYHDFTHGVDKVGDESVQILTSGLFSKKEVLTYAFCLLGVASAIGLVILSRTGWPTLVIGVMGLLLAVCYSWLKYHALGDITIFLEYAIFPVLGTSYVATGTWCLSSLLPAFIIGPVTVAILHANNARDIPSDKAAGIRTWAMLIGLEASRWVFVAETLFPYLIILVAILSRALPLGAALAFLALPKAMALNKEVGSSLKGKVPFSGCDRKTAGLQLIFSLLFAAGLALSAVVAQKAW
ncbi:MAG: prenyltransferase [Bacteroidales bacterium]|nr:prenyltransferase [Bacteroidales bacterium]